LVKVAQLVGHRDTTEEIVATRHRVLAPLIWLGIFGRIDSKLARFRQLSFDGQVHDALEFSNGEIELLKVLRRGLEATVLQLPFTIAADPATTHDSVPVQTLDHAEA
jgi:hypothetical protein